MGEVVIVSEELEFRTGNEREKKINGNKRKKKEETEIEIETWEEEKERKRGEVGSSNGLMKWERMLPRLVLRVLLVEADDSTRQIIAALLRKCSYRVAAVPDGLKAWEILKGRPHNIDLILTEVDLPSISGYALLALIMEHEICKNIPVIMMSSEDSINTVYKCMLRGAADYLVKPVRRNELRNLWQHVWRRKSSLVGGNGPQDESVGQDGVEGSSENNAASNHSSGNLACIQRNKECIEKGTDAQSSCTKPDTEAENSHMERMQEFLRPGWANFCFNDLKIQKHKAYSVVSQKSLMQESEAESKDFIAKPESQPMNICTSREVCDNSDAHVNSPREAIDFMGVAINRNSFPKTLKINSDSFLQLDLSLRRGLPTDYESQVTDEKHALRHSSASAFTRYTNRPLQLLSATLASTDSERKLLSNISGYNTPGPSPSTRRSIDYPAINQIKESEIATSCHWKRVIPTQIPANGLTFNNQCAGHGSAFHPVFYNQSGASSIPSPRSTSQPEQTFNVNRFNQSNYESNAEQLHDQLGESVNDSTNRTLQKQAHQLDSKEDGGHISLAPDQSASSSFCNGSTRHLNSMGCGSTSGSNGNADQVAVAREPVESTNEKVIFSLNTRSRRSIQREAALTKFHLKRKERCYEKKVRYENRKKLAEQRPRVKGQFVRQAHTDQSPPET